MAVRTFDRILIKAGARVFTEAFPLGYIVTQPFEQQCHCVISSLLSPEGYGEIVTWRSEADPKIYDWTQSSNVEVVTLREGTQQP